MCSIILNIQLAYDKLNELPTKSILTDWLKNILCSFHYKIEITIRLVGEKESCFLNMYYRGKNYPTNILSFPFESPPGIIIPLLGDLIICYPIVKNEAIQINKTFECHLAHIIVHGTLHLLGYDHILDIDSKRMTNMENKIMKRLGFDI